MLNKKWVGFFLIIMGIGFLLQQLDIFSFTYLWPLFLMLIGAILVFSRKSKQKTFQNLLVIISEVTLRTLKVVKL